MQTQCIDSLTSSIYNGLCLTYIIIKDKHNNYQSFSAYVEQHIKPEFKEIMHEAWHKSYISPDKVKEYVMNNYKGMIYNEQENCNMVC